jgi:hypothetical protein
MDFRRATDDLFVKVAHDDLANALGVSVATIRQARLEEKAIAHRAPPKGWEPIVAKLAEQKAAHFRQLAEKLRRQLEADAHKA